MQRKLYNKVTKYVREGYNLAIREKKYYIGFLLVLMQRLVTSSTVAITDSLEKRIKNLRAEKNELLQISLEDLMEYERNEEIEAILEVKSMDINAEIDQLTEILSVAKQARFQFTDAKTEKLLEVIEEVRLNDKNTKTIVFTEFVSTQSQLKEYLEKHNFKISTINGSMNIEERNIALKKFKLFSDILISTDAGGEGLNLQFANTVINYDLPWNPMKIEQRIGRVDRIGQVNDVNVFNFILNDTVENRVRTVLEEKLVTILRETGYNKISDVLDTEMAEVDFTSVYIRSINNPENVQYATDSLEKDLKRQFESVKSFKSLITDEKDLANSKIEETNFNLENSLMEMIRHYNLWDNGSISIIEKHSINDEEIIRHLKKELDWTLDEYVPIIEIKDYPNEEGYFTLWSLSINDNKNYMNIVPVFINKDFNYRHLSGKRIWEVLVENQKEINVLTHCKMSHEIFNKLKELILKESYQQFNEMKEEYEKDIIDKFNRYNYAIKLRMEAADKIGIINIKNKRLKDLVKEKQEIQAEYEKNIKICPVFKPIFMICLVG